MVSKLFSNFLEAILNIFVFLPYYFSTGPLLKTLFKPWKNLIKKKTEVGFSFEEWLGRLAFNLISRGIGFMMRVSILIFFVALEVIYIISIPFIFALFILLLPLNLLIKSLQKSDREKKIELKDSFIATHLLKEENRSHVEKWFEQYYKFKHLDYHWWKLENLLTQTPLARDWSVGFTPTLDQYCEELTSPSYQNKIKTTIDREKEIEIIESILSKNEEANVLIVGEEGVGKHAIVDAMSKKIFEGKINPLLVYKRILKLDMERILTQTTDQKQREALLELMFEEAYEAKNIIIMIENLDKYVISTQDRVNLSTPIEKYGKKFGLNFIATATPFNYQKFIFTNAAVNLVFTKIDVAEVSKEDAEEILLEKALLFEQHNQVIIPYETVKNTIEKSDFFITHIPFPEKAIDLLDNACAAVAQRSSKTQPAVVDPDVIDSLITETMHIPTKLDDSLKQKLIKLENQLAVRILFQKEALKQLTAAVQKSFLLFDKRKKPLASFLFLGPTGVGKTETAKALTQIFFDDEKHLIRFDMSAFQNREDVEKLIGFMATQIRQKPYGVLLLDEIEKANRDLINIFLTILDEGYFTDGYGQRVDCKNLMIIATSNAGSDYVYKNLDISSEKLINYLIEQKIFSPEFLNRFDGVIAYKPLTQDLVLQLAKRMIERIATNYQKLYKVTVKISDQTLTDVIKKNYHPEWGARDLERIITQEFEGQVAQRVLQGQAKAGETVFF